MTGSVLLYFGVGGGHQSVEESPHGAGIASVLRRAPGTPRLRPGRGQLGEGLVVGQQLLHLGLVVNVAHALQSHHHRPLPQRDQEASHLLPHVGEEVDDGVEVVVETLEPPLVKYWLGGDLLGDGVLDRLL